MRQARVASASEYDHIMMRGDNREYIFGSDHQKKTFLEFLNKASDEGLVFKSRN